MKALSHILVLALLTLGSCTSSLYTGAEYDDLYFLPSDKPVVKAKQSVNEQIAEGTLKAEDYYDNIYATDTLVSDQYSDAIDSGKEIIINNNSYGGGYDPYNYSYTGRLRRFYGNYFDPYWRDPFYSGYGYSPFGYSFGYGGFPYYNSYYNPFGYGGFYNDYYGGGYGGYYGGGYGGYYGGGYGGYYGGFGSYYSPFYSYGGSYYHNEGKNSVPYGRRERPSTLSSRWNSNVSASGSSRRDPYLSSGGNAGVARRIPSGTQTISNDARRTVSTNVNSQQAVNPTDRKLSQDNVKGENIRTNTTSQRNPVNVRPEYNSVNRTYTPSYSNPRMSTRPSYNNSRVSDGVNPGINRNNDAVNNTRINNNPGAVRTPSNQGSYQDPNSNVRSNSSVNSVQRRAVSPSEYSAPARESRSNSSGNSGTYSVPTRRSVESGSTYSPGSYNNSSSGSGSSGSVSGSSYSSGSSSGSTSGSSSSSSSSSSGSSSGRR